MKHQRKGDEIPPAVIEVHVRPRRRRGLRVPILAPIVLMLALGAGCIVLTMAVPAIGAALERKPGAQEPAWATAIWNLSDFVVEHKQHAIAAILLIGAAALVIGLVFRPIAWVVYLLGFALMLLDIAILVGAYSRVFANVMEGAGHL